MFPAVELAALGAIALSQGAISAAERRRATREAHRLRGELAAELALRVDDLAGDEREAAEAVLAAASRDDLEAALTRLRSVAATHPTTRTSRDCIALEWLLGDLDEELAARR